MLRFALQKAASTSNKSTRATRYRPRLERLEDRTLPATTITIVPGLSGTGSQDAAFLAHNGQLLFADPDIAANTLSTGALASISATTNIVVEATQTIDFDDLGGTLLLQTGAGNSATFSTATAGGGAIGFANAANTVATSGGDIIFTAGAGLTLAKLDTGGGAIALTAAGNVSVASANAQTAPVTITSTGGTITSLHPNDGVADVTGSTVTLMTTGAPTGALGQIGSFTSSAQFFEVSAAVISASTNNSRMWISLIGGAAIGSINAGTDFANIRSVNGDLTSNHSGAITARAVALVATNGSLGTAASPLLLATSTLSLGDNGPGNIVITNLTALTVVLAVATQGDIDLSTVAGDLTIVDSPKSVTITAPGHTVALHAGGAFVSGTSAGVTDVAGASLAMTATAGLGSGAAPLKTQVATLAFQNTDRDVIIHNSSPSLTIAPVAGLDTSLSQGAPFQLASIVTTGDLIFASFLNAVVLNATAGGSLTVQGVTITCQGIAHLAAGHDINITADATLNANFVSTEAGQANAQATSTIDGTFNVAGGGAGVDISGGTVFNINSKGDAPSMGVSGHGPQSHRFNITPGLIPIFVYGGDAPGTADPGNTLNVILAGTFNPHLSAMRSPSGYSGSWSFTGLPSIGFEKIESLVQGPRQAVGSDAGWVSKVKVFDAAGNLTDTFLAFDPSFTEGVRVAVGDVNGDGVQDIIVASGGVPDVPGSPAMVKVVDGTKLNMVDANGEIDNAAILGQFIAYDPGFLGGAFVAFGLSTNALPVMGADFGGGPHVKVIDATKINQLQPNGEIADSALIAQFYAYDPIFHGGVRVAAADLNGDGVLDIVTGAGPGGDPHVKVIDGTKLHDLQNNGDIADSALRGQFYAYSRFPFSTDGVQDGVFVAAAANNGHPIVVTGPGISSVGPLIKVIDAQKLNVLDNNSEPTGAALLAHFFAYDPSFFAGAHVAAADLNGDGVVDIEVGPGSPGFNTVAAQPVKIIDGTKLGDLQSNMEIADSALLDNFFAFGPGFTYGIFVGGH